MMKLLAKILFFILLGASTMLQAAKTMPYTILFTGKDGHSYFKDADEPLNPTGIGFTGQMMPVKNLFFGEGGGKAQDWHNPKQRLFIVVLAGIMQIETSRGESKNFKSGDILLAEDLTGKGHRTRNLDNKPVKYLAISLAD